MAIKVTARNRKLLYKIKYTVSNNLVGWNGLNYIEIDTEKRITEREIFEHIRETFTGNISIFADIEIKSCYLEETRVSRLI